MKIAVVCDVLGEENNGTTIAAMNLIRSLKSKGHTVRVLCPDQNRIGEAGYYIVPVRNLGPLNKILEWNQVVLAKRDSNIVRQALDGMDIVHIMLPFTLGKCAASVAQEMNIPITAGFHMMSENFTAHLAMQNVQFLNAWTYHSFDPLYKQCAAIHYPTQYLRDLYEQMIGPTNGYVISNGVNEMFHRMPAEKPDAWKNRDVILYTGRFSREKSHTVLIDAANLSAHRDRLQLIFAGEGPLKASLMNYAKKLPIPPVFHFFSRDELRKVLNFSDLYVHAAEIEAEGIACLEAIACGLVPIISNSPRCATKSYALDEKDLFQYDDPADLAKKIDWWLDHPAERAERSVAYQSYSKDNLTLSSCMNQMERMLLDVLDR